MKTKQNFIPSDNRQSEIKIVHVKSLIAVLASRAAECTNALMFKRRRLK